jgi:hypothetical protein
MQRGNIYMMITLISGGVVREVSSAPHVVNPLTVAVNGKGKERLILDLRHVNKQVVQNKIKFEDWKTAKQYMQILHLSWSSATPKLSSKYNTT